VSGTREASAPSDGIDNNFCNAATARSGSPICAATRANTSIGAGPSTASLSSGTTVISDAPETKFTNDDLTLTGKIAWAHLKEFPDNYTRLDEGLRRTTLLRLQNRSVAFASQVRLAFVQRPRYFLSPTAPPRRNLE
jgi:hypothetical protein